MRVRYMHADTETMERMELIRDLRLGEYDVLVGINLLREGLDLPEVGLVAILDADKEGYLRSTTSLIQTIGRAARNVHSRVIMYGDKITDSMQRAMDETARRREIQLAYNKEHNITPHSVEKSIRNVLEISRSAQKSRKDGVNLTPQQKTMKLQLLEQEMKQAAAELDFERAALLRDEMIALKQGKPVEKSKGKKTGYKGRKKGK